jgi:hypothetical protein
MVLVVLAGYILSCPGSNAPTFTRFTRAKRGGTFKINPIEATFRRRSPTTLCVKGPIATSGEAGKSKSKSAVCRGSRRY